MPVLTIMQGISGSGKSTRAAEIADKTNAVVVSTDLIRLALVDDPWRVDSDLVYLMRDAMIKAALEAGYDVVSDDTNIHSSHVLRLRYIAYECDARVQIVRLDVPLETCLKNNAHRAMMGGRHVPEDVIRRQDKMFRRAT